MKISVSRIKLFKACRCAYRLKYIEGLEPVDKPEALRIGTGYHAKVEQIYKEGDCDTSDFSKESAMALAYKHYVYPKFRMTAVEDEFEKDLGNGDILVGRVDGIAEDGYLVEHKTTSCQSLEEYEYNLQWDEQILAYMYARGVRKVWYTVIRKPNIRQKKGESDEEFFDRMCEWYSEDTDDKVRVFEIYRTDEEVEEFGKSLKVLVDEIKKANEDQKRLYRNPLYCNYWGRRCEYSAMCLDYDPKREYVGFKKEEREC